MCKKKLSPACRESSGVQNLAFFVCPSEIGIQSITFETFMECHQIGLFKACEVRKILTDFEVCRSKDQGHTELMKYNLRD